MPGMRLREKEPEDAHFERKTVILEKNEGQDRGEEQEEEGVGTAAVAGVGRVNGEDRVVEQLVDGSISSTLTQNHV